MNSKTSEDNILSCDSGSSVPDLDRRVTGQCKRSNTWFGPDIDLIRHPKQAHKAMRETNARETFQKRENHDGRFVEFI